MGRKVRLLYGSYQPDRGYLISRVPPDAPVRPSEVFETLAEVTAMAARRGAKILWFPQPPKDAP